MKQIFTYCTSGHWPFFLGAPPSTQTMVGNWGHVLKASELDLADTLLHLLCRRGGARVTTALLSVWGDGAEDDDVQRRIFLFVSFKLKMRSKFRWNLEAVLF